MSELSGNQVKIDATETPRSETRSTLVALLFLIALTCILFRQPLFFGRVLQDWDHGKVYVPVQVENARLRATGEFPLWYRCGFLGYPLQAETEGSGIYPPSVLFNLFSDPGAAYSFFIVLHYLLAAASMMYLLRIAGAGVAGQTVSALVFVLGGSYVAETSGLTLITTLAWTPLIVALQTRAIQRQSWGYAVLGAVVFAMQALGTHPHAAFFTLLIMALVILTQVRPAMSWQKFWFATGITGLILIVGSCLSAPQLLYFFDLLRESDRWQGLGYEDQVQGSLPPHYLLQLLVPNPAGNEFRVNLLFCDLRVYFGLLALSWIPLGWTTTNRTGALFRIVFAVGLFLALGRYTGAYHVLSFLPVFQSIHVPGRFLLVASFGAAGLAGLGFDRILHSSVTIDRYRRTCIRSYLVLAATLIALAAIVASHDASSSVAGVYNRFFTICQFDRAFLDEWTLVDTEGKLSGFVRSAGLSALFAGFSAYVWYGFGRWRRRAGLCAVILLAADLVVSVDPMNQYGPPDYYTSQPASVSYLKNQSGLWRAYGVYSRSEPQFLDSSRGLIAENTGGLFAIDSIGLNPAAPLTSLKFVYGTGNLKTFGLFNVKYVLSRHEIPELEVDLKFRHDEFRVYENPYFQPRVTFRTDSRVAPTLNAVWLTMRAEDFDLSNSVTINEAAAFMPGIPAKSIHSQPQVKVTHYGAHHVTIDALLPKPGILVLSDMYYRGWQATSNGRKLKILAANGVVRGLALGPGRHRVEFFYRPKSFYRGLYVSAVTALLLTGWGMRILLKLAVRKKIVMQPEVSPGEG